MIIVKDVSNTSDIATLIQQIDVAVWSKASEINAGDYTEETLRRYVDIGTNIFCVAYEDDIFAGIAAAYFLVRPDGEKWLYVDGVDTVQNKQKRGVGTALMRHLFDYAQKNNCAEVWLGTETDNISARALYTSLAPDEVDNFVGFLYTFNK